MYRHNFNPTPGTIYDYKGGGSYICFEAEGHFRAKFQRVSKYKWTGEPVKPLVGSFGCAILLPALSAAAIAFAKLAFSAYMTIK